MTKVAAGYGLVTRALHWTVAALIIGLLCLGWYMADLRYYDRWYNASLIIAVHGADPPRISDWKNRPLDRAFPGHGAK